MSQSWNDPLCIKKPRNDLDANLDGLDFGSKSMDEDWIAFRDVVYNSSREQLDLNQCNHQDWFDENNADNQVLLGETRQAFRAYQQDTDSTSKEAAYKSVKTRCSQSTENCRTPGSAEKRTKYRSTLMLTTTNASIKL